jgi:integrase
MRTKLSDAFAKTAPEGMFWDTDSRAPRGFGLRVTKAGARAWVFQYRVKGTATERRMTIGELAAWPITRARDRVAALRRVVDEGGDPFGQVEAKRAAPDVAELIKRFITDALPSRQPRTQVEYKSVLERYILPAIGRMKVTDVEREHLESCHQQISATGRLRRANAMLTIAHVLFEQAIRWRMRPEGSNPAKRVERNRENQRQRYLSPPEIERLLAALDEYQAKWPDSCDMIRLLLLTGSRRGEVVNMCWSHLDLDQALWTKPPEATKQRREHRVVLPTEAVELLRRRQAELAQEAPGRVVSLHRDDRVFPLSGVVAYRLERDWFRIRASAKLEDVRLHDLRHSYASLLVAGGYSLPVIGALLGHSKPATTQRYAHLRDQPVLREAAEVVGKIIGGKRGAP